VRSGSPTNVTSSMLSRASSRTRKLLLVPTALSAGLAAALLLAPAGVSAAAPPLSPPPVNLGTAGSYSVLTGPNVSNTGATTLAGNLGVSDTSGVVTGDSDITVGGDRHIGDDAAAGAQADANSAYTTAAGLTSTPLKAVELGGTKPAPGVYSNETLGLTGTLTLDANNDPNAYWVFQAGKTLITGVNSSVNLTGGADPCRIFWQIGSAATLDTGTAFAGTILASAAITLAQGVHVNGRLLGQTAGITLINDTIDGANCGSTGTGGTTTPASSPASSAPSTGGSTTGGSGGPSSTPTTATPADTSTPAPATTPAGGGATALPTAGTISQTTGGTAGGTLVTLTGTGFVPGHTSVTVGGTTVPASSVNVLSSTKLVFRTPAHAAGTVPISVTTSAGTTRTGLTFTYTSTTATTSSGTTTTLSSTGAPVTLLAEVAALLLLLGTTALAVAAKRAAPGRHRG
jgi:Ice-binding-like/IPT/TIG domain